MEFGRASGPARRWTPGPLAPERPGLQLQSPGVPQQSGRWLSGSIEEPASCNETRGPAQPDSEVRAVSESGAVTGLKFTGCESEARAGSLATGRLNRASPVSGRSPRGRSVQVEPCATAWAEIKMLCTTALIACH
jgi:hypothetical protein